MGSTVSLLRHLIIGPPGTGKTTRLLSIMEEEIASGVNPSSIAFVSFTKKAASEAADRAIDKFSLTKQDLPYFRTLHSLAFQMLGIRREEVMQYKHYRQIGNLLGLTFSNKSDLEEGLPSSHFTGDRYVFLDGYARARRLTPETAWRLLAEDDLNWFEFERFQRTLHEYKRVQNLIDFSDMLEQCQRPLDVDVVILDEAQDCSTAQWFMFFQVFKNAKKIYVAGDDDQAIFQWSGADVAGFQKLPNLGFTQEVLEQSHRVPAAVHRLAEGITGQIQHRYAKKYLPKAEQGLIEYHRQPDDVDLSQGSWLLLARNTFYLRELVAVARAQGVSYSYRGEPAVNPIHVKAIAANKRLREGAQLSPDEQNYIKEFKKLPIEDKEYYASLLRRGESLTKAPRVHINTIHGVKGGEADNVLLMTDMTQRTYNSMDMDPDSEHRVFYVGITRAKKALHIVQPQTVRGYVI